MSPQTQFQGIFGLSLARARFNSRTLLRWWCLLGLCTSGDGSQLLLNVQVALSDLLLHLPVVVQSLTDHEEQFGAIIARQGRFDLGLAFLDPMIDQRGKFFRVAFTRQNRIQNRLSALSADISQHVMQVKVHLTERLLDVLDPHGPAFDQVFGIGRELHPMQRIQHEIFE